MIRKAPTPAPARAGQALPWLRPAQFPKKGGRSLLFDYYKCCEPLSLRALVALGDKEINRLTKLSKHFLKT